MNTTSRRFALSGIILCCLLIVISPLSSAEFDNTHLIADAAKGDPEAQYTLAHLYLKGRFSESAR